MAQSLPKRSFHSVFGRGGCLLMFLLGSLLTQPLAAQTIAWKTDLESAKQEAGRDGKLVLLHFSATWCNPCQSLNRFVFSSPRVTDTINTNVVPVQVDADQQPDLVERYGVSSIPYDIVMTSEGRVVQRRKSPRDSEEYVRMIDGLAPILYQLSHGGSGALAQNLDEIERLRGIEKDLYEGEREDITPDKPKFMMARPSSDSSDLHRNYLHRQPASVASGTAISLTDTPNNHQVVDNPFFQSAPSNEALPSVEYGHQPNSPVDASRDQRQTASTHSELPQSAKPEVKVNQFFALDPSSGRQIANESATDARPTNAATIDSNRRIGATEPGGSAVAGNQESFQSRSVASRPVATAPVATELAFEPQQPAAQSQPAFEFPMTTPPQVEERAQQDSGLTLASTSDGTRPEMVANAGGSSLSTNASENSFQAPTVNPSLSDRTMQSGNSMLTPQLVVEADETVSQTTGGDSASDQAKARIVNAEPVSAAPTPSLALQGKCPVTLIAESRWVAGNPQIGCVHRNRTYLFTSEENRERFLADPDQFSPLLAGYDPVMYQETGKLISGDEAYGVFMGRAPDHRIVLFVSPDTRDRFQAAPQRYLDHVRQAVEKSSLSKLRR